MIPFPHLYPIKIEKNIYFEHGNWIVFNLQNYNYCFSTPKECNCFEDFIPNLKYNTDPSALYLRKYCITHKCGFYFNTKLHQFSEVSKFL
jgi:hypothetical protein